MARCGWSGLRRGLYAGAEVCGGRWPIHSLSRVAVGSAALAGAPESLPLGQRLASLPSETIAWPVPLGPIPTSQPWRLSAKRTCWIITRNADCLARFIENASR